MSFSVSNQNISPVIATSGADLRFFRPREVKDDRLRIVGYLPGHYEVKVALAEDTMWEWERMYFLCKGILNNFPKKGFLDVNVQYIDNEEDDPYFRIKSRFVFRLVKGDDGAITACQLRSSDVKQNAADLEGQGFAHIELITLFGFKDVVVRKQRNFNREALDLRRF